MKKGNIMKLHRKDEANPQSFKPIILKPKLFQYMN